MMRESKSILLTSKGIRDEWGLKDREAGKHSLQSYSEEANFGETLVQHKVQVCDLR
jgi:hypothetical protein